MQDVQRDRRGVWLVVARLVTAVKPFVPMSWLVLP